MKTSINWFITDNILIEYAGQLHTNFLGEAFAVCARVNLIPDDVFVAGELIDPKFSDIYCFRIETSPFTLPAFNKNKGIIMELVAKRVQELAANPAVHNKLTQGTINHKIELPPELCSE